MNDINPRELLRYITWVLFKHKLSIAALIVFTVVCFAFGTFLITPQWSATAKLLVLQDPKQQMILFGDLESPMQVNSLTTGMDLVEILTGNELAAKIVDEFDLDERRRRAAQEPETTQEWAKYWLVQAFTLPTKIQVWMGWRDEPQPNWFEKALDDVLEEMEDIDLVEETSTIYVTIWADDRQLAVDICNAMVDHLLEKTRDFDRAEAAKTHAFVEEQLLIVEAALNEAEDELFEFKESNDIVELETERTLLLTRMDGLKSAAATQQARIASLNAKYDELLAQLGDPASPRTPDPKPEGAVSSEQTSVQSNPYGGFRNAINERQTEQVILQTKVDLSEAEGEFASLKADMKDLQQQIDTLNRKDLESQRLLRSSLGLRDRYLNLRKKQLELEVQRFTETSEFDIKIADSAYIPPRAEVDWPSWGLNLAVGLVLGVVFAIGQAFFFEYWRDTFNHSDELVQIAGVEVLGTVKPISISRMTRQIGAGQPATRSANNTQA